MEKIKNIVLKLVANIKSNGKEYKFTNMIIMTVTFLFMIGIENNFFTENLGGDFLGNMLLFGVVSASTTFLIETLFQQREKKIIGDIISLGIGLVFTFLCYSENSVWQETTIRVLAGYLIAILAGSIFIRIKRKQITMPTYCLKVFQNLLRTGIIYLILNIGLMIITTIFMILILEKSKWELILRIQIALLGFYLLPSSIKAITNVENQTTKFTKGLILYVLLPLVSIAMMIIYLYMSKILILWQIPSNAIFRILAGIFMVGFPVYRMACVYKEENKFIYRITNMIPWAFIPFIVLQIYSMYVRCIEYGITPLRYLCWILVVYEIVAIVLAIHKKQKKAEYSLIAIIVLAIVSTMTPWNIVQISNRSQASILNKAWQQGVEYSELTEEQKQKARGAYRYLKDLDNADNYLPEYLPKETLNQLVDYHMENRNSRTEYVYYDSYETKEIDITNYTKMKIIDEVKDDTKITGAYNEILRKIAEQYEINETTGEEYLNKNKIIHITEKEDLYIQNITMRYKVVDNEISIDHYSIEGYLLQK